MAKRTRVPVTRRALIQRVNRAIAKDGGRLHVTRGAQALATLGSYYVSNGRRGYEHVTTYGIEDLEAWARENVPGVLRDFETLVD